MRVGRFGPPLMRPGNTLLSACASARRYALVGVGWDQSVRCPLEFGYRLGRRRVAVLCLIWWLMGTSLGSEGPLVVAGGESFAATRAGCRCSAGELLGAGLTVSVALARRCVIDAAELISILAAPSR